MEILLDELLKNVELIIRGVPLKWEEIPQEKRKTILTIALHCCLNGPVGVNKDTEFPLVGRAAIKSLVPSVTNSSWRGFCEGVANYLVSKRTKIECNSVRRLNAYWPLVSWT
jgi:hypothetical protein